MHAAIAVGLARFAALAVCAATACAQPPAVAPADLPPVLASAVVERQRGAGRAVYEGVVEALRQTALAAQVPGAVVALHVKAGDRVRAGQVLVRLDARAAAQAAAAGAAQANAARASLEVAAQDFERQRQLFAQGFISQAAIDRAQATFKSAQAQASAQGALAGAATTQSEFHVVRAPYDGVVASVAVVQGDMALPGRPLLVLYDPAALRISAAIPQTVARQLTPTPAAEVEIPGTGWFKPARALWLPTVDAASHTLELRLDLPDGVAAVPGMFARVRLATGATEARLFVPARAVVQRAEFAAVYVLADDARPMLRQVRAGRGDGARVEVLAGLAAGERVALDPQAAARLR